MSSPEQSIRAAFRGDDDLHRSVRIALLRVLHFGQSARNECSFIAEWLDHVIEDPPWCIGYGPVRPRELVKDLRRAAYEIERAVIALDAAQPLWQRFCDSEGTPDGIRGDRERAARTNSSNEPDTPF